MSRVGHEKVAYGNRSPISQAGPYTITTLLTVVVSAVTGVVLARYLGLDDYGRYATATALLGLTGILSDLGTNQVVVRDGSRDPQVMNERSRQVWTITIISSFASWFVAVGVAFLSGYDDTLSLFILAYGVHATLLSSVISHVFFPIYQVRGKLPWFSAVRLGGHMLSLLFILIGIALGFPLIMVGLAAILSSSVTIVILLIFGEGGGIPTIQFSGLTDLLKQSLPFGASNILTLAYMQGGLVLLSYLGPMHEVGVFAAPYRIIVMTYLFPSALYTILQSRTFVLGKTDIPALVRTGRAFMRIALTGGMLISIALYLYADHIISFSVGKQFQDSAPLLRILCATLMLKFLSFPIGLMITSTDQQPKWTTVQAVVTPAFLFSALLAVTWYGPTGLAFAVLFSDTLLTVGYSIVAFRSRLINLNPRDVLLPAAAAGVVLGTSWLLGSVQMLADYGGLMALGIVIPFLFFRYFTSEERGQFAQFLFFVRAKRETS